MTLVIVIAAMAALSLETAWSIVTIWSIASMLGIADRLASWLPGLVAGMGSSDARAAEPCHGVKRMTTPETLVAHFRNSDVPKSARRNSIQKRKYPTSLYLRIEEREHGWHHTFRRIIQKDVMRWIPAEVARQM